MNEIITATFLAVVTAMLVLVMTLIIMNLYEIFEEPAIQKRMRRLRTSSQPWVTVLLYVRDNETTVQNSLESILNSNYARYDVVVINDRSKDKTLSHVQDFIRNHPKAPITLVNRRKRGTTQSALEAGYKKSKHGEVVLSLRSDIELYPECIKRAVATVADKQKTTIRFFEPIKTSTLTEIIQSLNNLLWLRTRKVNVSDRYAITPTKLEVNLDIFTVLLFLAILSVSIITKETIIVWYSWIIVTGYLCAVILLNPEGLKTKIKLTFSAVSALFLLPVSSLIQAFSQFRSRI